MRSEDQNNPLAVEIMAEKAAAYFTTVKKMEAALGALQDFDRTPAPKTSLQEKRRRAELLAEAAERAWFFIIQREAMKLPFYPELFAEFQIPEEVRQKMGPKRTND